MCERENHRWYLCRLVLFFALLCVGFDVSAAGMEKQVVTIYVSDYTGIAEELRLCSDENVYDSDGGALLRRDDIVETSFSRDERRYKAQAELYEGVRYYISDGIVHTSFEVSGLVSEVSFGNGVIVSEGTVSESQVVKAVGRSASTGELGISAKMPQTANAGERVKCVVDELSGSEESVSDTFLLQCEIPDGMELESVYTGTYSDNVALQLLCRTENDNKWHIWGDGIRSDVGETFETSSMNFAEGDRISAFAVSAESVPEGFSINTEEPCYYFSRVSDDSLTDFSGAARVTAYIGGQKSASESTFTTALQTGVQTGDENVIFLGSVILLVISFCVLVSYLVIRIVVYKREKNVEKEVLPVKFNNYKSRNTSEKMSSLLEKKPG